jgi:hypothetical protein
MMRGVLRPIAEVQREWEEEKVYCVAPRGIQMSLHLLVKGAQMASTPEEARPYLDRMEALLELAWPTSTPRDIEILPHKGFQIIVPKS